MTRSFDAYFICAWINGWVYTRGAGDVRRHRAHYDVIVMCTCNLFSRPASSYRIWYCFVKGGVPLEHYYCTPGCTYHIILFIRLSLYAFLYFWYISFGPRMHLFMIFVFSYTKWNSSQLHIILDISRINSLHSILQYSTVDTIGFTNCATSTDWIYICSCFFNLNKTFLKQQCDKFSLIYKALIGSDTSQPLGEESSLTAISA